MRIVLRLAVVSLCFFFGASAALAEDVVNFDATGGSADTVTLGSTELESDFEFELELNTKGAAVSKATFSEFNDRHYKNPQPLVILSGVGEVLPMANKEFVFVEQQQQLSLNRLNWKSSGRQLEADGSQAADFEAFIKIKDTNEPTLKLTKTYKIFPGSYMLDINLTIENLSANEQKVRFNMNGPIGLGREDVGYDMRKVVGGFITSEAKVVSSKKSISAMFFSKKVGLKKSALDYEQALRTGVNVNEARQNMEIGRNLPGNHSSARFLWLATTNKYFAAILRPVPADGQDFCDWIKSKTSWYYNPDGDAKGKSGDETIGAQLEIDSVTLAPTGQAESVRTYNFQLYLGPKDKDLFYKNELYKGLGFVQTIDFMTCCCPASIISPLAFGILAAMKWMYSFIPNYGVVIIILVFLIRIVIHPLTKKSQVSMNKMTKLAPKAEEIKKKYANNKTEMNKQLMAIYKEQGASPVMGFLPMMVQMPVWIALFSAINASIALRGAAFLPFWITDLSAPDALIRFSAITLPIFGKISSLNLLPILMGVAFYLQQKLMPKSAATANSQAAQQQKMMMIMMPIMFPLMLYNRPSGLNLYIMASTFAGVIEQYFIRKHIREKEEAESKGLVAVTSKTGGKVKKKKPKPFYKM